MMCGDKINKSSKADDEDVDNMAAKYI